MSRLQFTAFAMALIFSTGPGAAAGHSADPSTMSISAERNHAGIENPLHSEVAINGTTINNFTSDTIENIAEHLKDGWNTITVTTRPQEPANRYNQLIFRIGPATKDASRGRIVMQPVLWEFRNGTDWSFKEGVFSHRLGPGVKEVAQTYDLYFAGLDRESREVKAGDFVLIGGPVHRTLNAPVTATVFVNGTPLNTFTTASRQIVVTSLLKPGKNEIKLVSHRVENTIRNNDIELSIAGPAEWNVQRNQFTVTPVIQFKAMQGWSMDPKTGMLISKLKPGADQIERTIPLFIKGEEPEKQ